MKYFGITDIGNIRKSNQDRYTILNSAENDLLFAAVCDGMGGANGGETASSLAVDTIETVFVDFCKNNPKYNKFGTFLTEAASKANSAIYYTASQNPSLEGMGTTFVGFVANNNKVALANVGDSRAYLVSSDDIRQITVDHSLINEMVQQGRLSHKEALSHPVKNVITRALGVDTEVQCDTYSVEVKKGDYILLCSDGLTEEVSEPEIHFEVLNSKSVESACKSLVKLANSRGGHDNISVVIGGF